jgi:hypothetical protein
LVDPKAGRDVAGKRKIAAPDRDRTPGWLISYLGTYQSPDYSYDVTSLLKSPGKFRGEVAIKVEFVMTGGANQSQTSGTMIY